MVNEICCCKNSFLTTICFHFQRYTLHMHIYLSCMCVQILDRYEVSCFIVFFLIFQKSLLFTDNIVWSHCQGIIHALSPKVLGVKGWIGKSPSPTSARDSAKLEYISGGNPHPMS